MALRITGGQWRNRTIPVPPGFNSRPTTDKVRQALFNLMAHAVWAHNFSLQDAVIVDGFAGTGAVGLEALSRGAKHCLFIDSNMEYLEYIQNLAAKWDITDQVTMLQADLTQALPTYPLAAKPDLIFLDPPYDDVTLLNQALQNLVASHWLTEKTLVVIEQPSKIPLSLDKNWTVLDQRQYGISQLVFLVYT